MIYFFAPFLWNFDLACITGEWVRVSFISPKFDFLSSFHFLLGRTIWRWDIEPYTDIRMWILLAHVSIFCHFDSHEHLDIRFICVCYFFIVSVLLSLFWGVCIVQLTEEKQRVVGKHSPSHTHTHCDSRNQERRNNMCKLFLCFRYVANFPFCCSLLSHASQTRRAKRRKCGFGDGNSLAKQRKRDGRILQMTFILFSCNGCVFYWQSLAFLSVGLLFSDVRLWLGGEWIYGDYEIRNRCEWMNRRYPCGDYL